MKHPLLSLVVAGAVSLPSYCVWKRCGQKNYAPINCGEPEYGTSKDLAAIIKATVKGSVMSHCAQEERELKVPAEQ